MTVSLGSLRRAAVVAPFAIYTSLAIGVAHASPLPEPSTNGTITGKPALSPNSRLPSFLDYSGGNDTTRYEISPNYSDKLGWSLRGSLGSYVTNDLAVGLIAEFGRDKREYLANAGVQLNKELSFIGSVGMLDEHQEYVAGDGKQTVQQMEYGGSLKGAYSIGFLHGFELNGYLADANTKSDTIETGKLYGAQLLTNVFLTDTTHLKFGGGYEWLRWDGGEEDNHFSFRADGTQEISDRLSLNANVKLGASEYVYGGGLIYNLGDGTNTNTLALNYDYIEGKNGVLSDKRVELVWTMGLGVGPNAQPTMQRGTNSKNLRQNIEPVGAPVSSLLADVMKRPEFLPKQVLARAKSNASNNVCSAANAANNVGTWNDVPAGLYFAYNNTIDNEVNGAIGTFELYSYNSSIYTDTGISITFSSARERVSPTIGTIPSPVSNDYVLYAFAQGPDGSCNKLYWENSEKY